MKNTLTKGLSKLKNKTIKEKKGAMRQQYLEYYQTLALNEKAVFLEARNGKEIDGNIYYIVKELLVNPKYKDLTLFVAAEKGLEEVIATKIRTIPQASDGSTRIQIITVESKLYYEIAASAKYIVSDATLKNFFIKKQGQIYLNVWHGTPFKVMGKKVAHEPHAVGNAQKNFSIADYLLYPNEYMMDHMIEDYMIANTSSARILLGGYPRNTAFFDDAKAVKIKSEQGLEISEQVIDKSEQGIDKKEYVYMPTYRPSLMGETLCDVLDEMDNNLRDNETLYAKVHPLASDKVDYSKYKHIEKFPQEYETYEFLNIADCLITDYSSVFYDFAVTGRKIVLYTYDEEEYLSTRGLYEPISSLPFTQVKTIAETLEAARTPKDYDDSEFIDKYCKYESAKATEALCKRFIRGEADDFTKQYIYEKEMPANGKKNAFVYVSNLRPGEKTDQLMDYLKSADKEEYNWFLTFERAKVAEDMKVLLNLPAGIEYFGRAGKAYETKDADQGRHLEELRCFGNMHIDKIVHL